MYAFLKSPPFVNNALPEKVFCVLLGGDVVGAFYHIVFRSFSHFYEFMRSQLFLVSLVLVKSLDFLKRVDHVQWECQCWWVRVWVNNDGCICLHHFQSSGIRYIISIVDSTICDGFFNIKSYSRFFSEFLFLLPCQGPDRWGWTLGWVSNAGALSRDITSRWSLGWVYGALCKPF